MKILDPAGKIVILFVRGPAASETTFKKTQDWINNSTDIAGGSADSMDSDSRAIFCLFFTRLLSLIDAVGNARCVSEETG